MIRPPSEIAIAVVEQGDRFLAGRRAAGLALAGYWEFPGGKIEPGESAAEAACRECLEETGLAVEIVGEYPTQRQTYDHGELTLRFFAARLIGDRQEPRNGFCWIARERLGQLRFPAGNGSLLKQLQAGNPAE